MILYKDFGKHLRWGNFAFCYFSLLTIAKRSGHKLVLPNYFAWDYLLHPPEIDHQQPYDEPVFHFRTHLWSREEQDWLYQYFTDNQDKNININLGSNNQSELWFADEIDYIKEMCQFKPEAIQKVKEKYSHFFTKKTIGVGIRRGDFVGHGVFYQIPEMWYENALHTHFNLQDYNIVIFSDDIDWCKSYFAGKPYLYAEANNTHTHTDNFAHYRKDPMEQFILGCLMDNFIGGSSTFSWWQMWYIKNLNEGTVIHCGRNLSEKGEQEFGHNPNYYPGNWICHSIK